MSPAHVLVIDDEILMRTLLRDFLSSQGYQVTCYATGASALKTLEQRKNAISAVVADIRMSPMNGMDLLLRVKSQYPLVPVLLFTSGGSPEEREEALHAGAAHYFTKPFLLSDLARVLGEAIKKKSPSNQPD